jgi:broad specificity phosphatase PhoE
MVDAETSAALGLPDGIRTTGSVRDDVTRLVLVRHGEANCNVSGVCGGQVGCSGLSGTGRAQVAVLADHLRRTGELGAVDALYASTLPRAKETAAILAPALDAWRTGAPLSVRADCGLCELHPGEADGLTWAEYGARFTLPDWDVDPGTPIAPGGEGWSGFVDRASSALADLVGAHPGQTVVVATHAGVVEASVLRFLPVDPAVIRLRLRTIHASLTVWEHSAAGGWLLQRYNDVAPVSPAAR